MKNNISLNMQKGIEIINENDNIFIASHINPDGDNLGSVLGLYLALKKKNKNVYPLISDFIPEDFLFLPGIEDMIDYSEDLGNIDIIILLDSSDEERLGENKELLEDAKYIINIDHHISNTDFGDINIVDSKAAATAELIYDFINMMDIQIDKDIATNLYTGISTDTGKFSYDSVTSKTHRIIADLIDRQVDFPMINRKIYESKSMEQMRLYIKAMSSMENYHNNKIATVKITQKMLEETGASMEDSEGIVESIRQIEDVEVACLLKEIKNNQIKLSLRSKEYADVAQICSNFNGGGHIRAAGCTINQSINKAERLIVDNIKENL